MSTAVVFFLAHWERKLAHAKRSEEKENEFHLSSFGRIGLMRCRSKKVTLTAHDREKAPEISGFEP